METSHINVRISGPLVQHLHHQISVTGLYENASEYVRDLIRKDMQSRKEAWDWLNHTFEPALKADKSKVTAQI